VEEKKLVGKKKKEKKSGRDMISSDLVCSREIRNEKNFLEIGTCINSRGEAAWFKKELGFLRSTSGVYIYIR